MPNDRRHRVAPNVSIGFVGKGDRVSWEVLWRNFLALLKITLSDETIATTWERIHDPTEPVFLLGAYVQGRLTGIAHFIQHRSCLTPGDLCYLDSLFVSEEARNHGIGRALIDAVCSTAVEHGASRVYWLVNGTNIRAQHLYEQVAERSSLVMFRRNLGCLA
jgi:ribosomal protein S18 acetylase RimI-like enzyme